MKKIIVASQNPVKLNAARLGFERMFPNETFEVGGVSVPSDVRDQPMDNDETYLGASNRAAAASKAQAGDYWVGIEGGIEVTADGMQSFAWIIIRNTEGLVGKGKTSTYFLPPAVAKLVLEGKELGEADDIVFGKTNSKQSNGSVGLLTNDVVHRTSYYTDAVILAAIPFLNQELYS